MAGSLSCGQKYLFRENAITKLEGPLLVRKVFGCRLGDIGGEGGPLSVMKVWQAASK